jgi:hypothetical protein
VDHFHFTYQVGEVDLIPRVKLKMESYIPHLLVMTLGHRGFRIRRYAKREGNMSLNIPKPLHQSAYTLVDFPFCTACLPPRLNTPSIFWIEFQN